MLVQALQSISMAEERQGEAHADGLAKLSSLQASAALQQALALASNAGAANSVAGYGGFAQAPVPAAPENGLAALQVVLVCNLCFVSLPKPALKLISDVIVPSGCIHAITQPSCVCAAHIYKQV